MLIGVVSVKIHFSVELQEIVRPISVGGNLPRPSARTVSRPEGAWVCCVKQNKIGLHGSASVSCSSSAAVSRSDLVSPLSIGIA